MSSDHWIQLTDSEVDSAALAAWLAQETQRIDTAATFPEFEPTVPPETARFPHLAHHLRALNGGGLPSTEPLLMPSALQRVPGVGKLYASVRAALHSLTLFYLNRHIRHLTQQRLHLLHVLNELAQLRAAQDAHLTQLHTKHHDDA